MPAGRGAAAGPPSIDTDAGSLGTMLRDAKRVSDALALAGIRHRFTLYNDNQEMVGYLHHGWPCDDNS